MTTQNSAAPYVQIIPCSGWSYKHNAPGGGHTLHPIAVWAMLEDGEVIGLIAVTEGGMPKLVRPPPATGSEYVQDAQ